MRAILLGCAVSACSSGATDTLPISDPPAASKTTSAAAAGEAAERAELATRIDYLRHAVRRHLARKFPFPPRRKSTGCSRASGGPNTPTVNELAVVVQDDRIQARTLVPLRLTGAVARPDLSLLDAPLPASHRRGLPGLRDRVRELEAARSRELAAVHHVIHYAQPKRIRKPNKRRAEWVPGWIITWLAVHDLKSGQPLCQTRVLVKNDVSTAPLSPRLQSETRRRLTTALGEDLWEATRTAVNQLSTELRLPADDPRRSAKLSGASRPGQNR